MRQPNDILYYIKLLNGKNLFLVPLGGTRTAKVFIPP
jgi:hypothetical protein